MRLQRLIAFSAFTSAVCAIDVVNGVLKTHTGKLEFSASTPAKEAVVFDSSASKVDISFDIVTETVPDQIVIKVSNKEGLEASFNPVVKEGEDSLTAKYTLSYGKLPKVFTKEPFLDVSIIAATTSDDAPVFAKIASLELAESLISESKYVKPQRFEVKPEIHHIFKEKPRNVNSVIAITFASLSVVALFGLIISWIAEGAINFTNFPTTNISHWAFILTIVGYEVVFLQYYLGSSIFATIFKVGALTPLSVWFGSKVLNYVGALRLAGKR